MIKAKKSLMRLKIYKFKNVVIMDYLFLKCPEKVLDTILNIEKIILGNIQL